MRIIRGKYGRRRFSVPSTFSARPTTDFAKENLFNVLENIIDFEDMTALDLFGGTGSISFELLSRDCKHVTCVEKHRAHAAFIEKCAGELKCGSEFALIKGDVFRFLENAPAGAYDIIFADPPYALKGIETIPGIIKERKLLREGGLLIFEHGKDNDFSDLSGFDQKRVYGSVNFSMFYF